MNKLAIIGGSGLYNIDGIKDEKWITVKTPWGEPSDQILEAKIDNKQIYFLPRHSRGHKINPTNIPRKNGKMPFILSSNMVLRPVLLDYVKGA